MVVESVGKKQIKKQNKMIKGEQTILRLPPAYYTNFYPQSVNYSRRQAVRSIYLFVRLKRRSSGGCIHHGRLPLGVKIARRTRRSSRRITDTGGRFVSRNYPLNRFKASHEPTRAGTASA